MNKTLSKYDYGKCDVCNTPMREQLVKQDFWIRGELIVIEDVPAGVCPNCGEKVVQAYVGKKIGELIDNPDRIANAPRISVPSIKLGLEKVPV